MASKAKSKRQYRSKIQIAADILEVAKQGSRKTKIMYMSNLSFDLLEKYLDLLVNFGLLEVQIRGQRDKNYIATEKGKRFLDDFRELQNFSRMAATKKRDLESSLASLAA